MHEFRAGTKAKAARERRVRHTRKKMAKLIIRLRGRHFLRSFNCDVDSSSPDAEKLDALMSVIGAWGAQRSHAVFYLVEQLGVDPTAGDDKGFTPLHHAVWCGRYAFLVYFLCHLARSRRSVRDAVNLRRPKDGKTLLAVAAKLKHATMVKHLLRMGATHRLRDNRGDTPLHVAARWGSLEIAELLLDAGAEIDARNHHGATPLLLASETGSAKLIQLLAQNGADILAVCRCKRTALDAVVSRKQLDMHCAKHLISLGVPINATDEHGDTTLCRAVKESLYEVALILLDHDADTTGGALGRTPLHLAMSGPSYEPIVSLLLARGADPEAKDTLGLTPLDLAVQRGHETLAGLLRDNPRQEPSHPKAVQAYLAAAEKGRLLELKRWLERGVDINVRDASGFSALSLAASANHMEIVRFLLGAGKAVVDFQDEGGHTALWWAAWHGHLEMVSLLSEEGGARLDLEDNEGWTPAFAAEQRGMKAVAALLLATTNDAQSQASDDPRETIAPKRLPSPTSGSEVDDDLTSATDDESGRVSPVVSKPNEIGIWARAVRKGSTAEVRRLLRTGNHQDFADPKGVVPLMFAAKLGRTDVMEVLLEHGGDLEIRDSDGATALCWAASCSSASASEREKALQLLLDRGANHNIRDNDGMTPLMLALETPRENLGAVKLLVSRGADVNIADNKGCTALFHATRWVLSTLLTEVVEVLLHAGADVGHRNDDGLTALYWAARRGHIAAVTMLLEAAAKLSESESNEVGGSALCNAAVSGREAVAALLIARGVDINFRDARGQTPLLLACEKGQIAIAEMLISHGADSSAKDSQGQTALALAQKAGNSSVVKLLSQMSIAKGHVQRAGFGDTRPYLYQGLQLASSIRLVELSPGEPEDMLCLDMYEVSLDDEPIYQALSYEWGEKMGSISVRCGDSHHLLVTPNLETALLHLRSREKTMILWIDALCINQNDMQERSKQVSMMKRIFLGASSVFLWIGRDSPDTRAGMQTARQLSAGWDAICRQRGWKFSSPFENYKDKGIRRVIMATIDRLAREADPGGTKTYGLQNIFLRSYFTRLWIVQEILTAGPAGVVLCGHQRCGWDAFQKALWFMNMALECWGKEELETMWPAWGGVIGQVTTGNPAFRSVFGGLALNFEADVEVKRASSTVALLSSALALMAPFDTTDPRDRVYAALAFVSKYHAEHLPPNYDLAVQQVYTKAARGYISGVVTGNRALGGSFLDPSLSRPTDKTITGLPTWVPDWTTTPRPRHTARTYMGNFYTPLRHVQVRKVTSATHTKTSLFLPAFIIDRVTTRYTSIPDTDSHCKNMRALAEELALRRGGTTLFDQYPVGVPAKMQPQDVSYLQAFWWAVRDLRGGDQDKQKDRENDWQWDLTQAITSFTLWKIGAADPLLEAMPKDLRTAVEEWDVRHAENGPEFDFGICDWIENSRLPREPMDVLLTERGLFAVTSELGDMKLESLVVAKLGCVGRLQLLREVREGDVTYYEYVDGVDVVHMGIPLEKLPGVQEERIEIR